MPITTEATTVATAMTFVNRSMRCTRGDWPPLAPTTSRASCPTFVALPRRVFGNRERFAGQQRFIDFKSVLGQQPQVGRDTIARLQPDNIAGDDLFCCNVPYFAVALHRRPYLQQFL